MTDYARPGLEPKTWIEIDGAFTIPNGQSDVIAADPDDPGQNLTTVVSDRVFPHGWADTATPRELAEIGAKEILPADSMPGGNDQIGVGLIDFKGKPKRVILYNPVTITAARDRARLAVETARQEAAAKFTYDGVVVQTEAVLNEAMSQVSLRTLLAVPPEEPRTFKLANGEFREWNYADLVAFIVQASGHLQACTDLEASTGVAIAAAEDSATAMAIPETVVWPT